MTARDIFTGKDCNSSHSSYFSLHSHTFFLNTVEETYNLDASLSIHLARTDHTEVVDATIGWKVFTISRLRVGLRPRTSTRHLFLLSLDLLHPMFEFLFLSIKCLLRNSLLFYDRGAKISGLPHQVLIMCVDALVRAIMSWRYYS
jgi:hypothetical protein